MSCDQTTAGVCNVEKSRCSLLANAETCGKTFLKGSYVVWEKKYKLRIVNIHNNNKGRAPKNGVWS